MDTAATVPPPARDKAPGRSSFGYYALFFASGFPALIYQIVWQRALFTIYGVNIQSVTVIVTVFMLGLGIGSLAGGRISIVPGLNVLRAFGLIELAIGTFGAFSLVLFHYVERFTAGKSASSTAIVSFLLLLVPTLLMGSTLPLLVEHLVRETVNVGQSVGFAVFREHFRLCSCLFCRSSLSNAGSWPVRIHSPRCSNQLHYRNYGRPACIPRTTWRKQTGYRFPA